MNILHLQYFVELAHTHSYALSAERLHISQPNLSYGISQLEQELGVPLVEKNGRTNVLTEFGRQFLVYAEGTLKTLDAGVNAIKEAASGSSTVRLGFLTYLGASYIPRLIRDFESAYPGSDVRFSFETGSTRTLMDGLDAARYDFVFCAPTREVLFSSHLVKRQSIVLAVPNWHPLAERESVTLKETESYPYIYYTRGSGIRNVTDRYFEKADFRPNVLFEAVEDQVILGFIAAGFGIGVLPETESLRRWQNIRILSITEPEMARDVSMFWNKKIYMPPAQKQFEHFVRSGRKV